MIRTPLPVLVFPILLLCGSASPAAETRKMSVIIQASANAPFGNVLPVIRAVERSGAANTEFAIGEQHGDGIVATIETQPDVPASAVAKLKASLEKAGVARVLVKRLPPPGPVAWQEFSQDGLAKLLAADKPVLVFCRADWCLICAQLDRTLFNDKDVAEKIEELGYVALRADFTHVPEEIKRFLEKYGGASSVPTVVVFRGREKEAPVVLRLNILRREITSGDLLDAMTLPERAEEGREKTN